MTDVLERDVTVPGVCICPRGVPVGMLDGFLPVKLAALHVFFVQQRERDIRVDDLFRAGMEDAVIGAECVV